jgi:hypothetical protein
MSNLGSGPAVGVGPERHESLLVGAAPEIQTWHTRVRKTQT